MKCPRDHTPLQITTAGEINYYFCPNCHGLLLRRESFRRMKKDAPVEYPRSQRFCVQFEEGKTLSPYDGKRMQTLIYDGVKIDVCPSSNYIWFDHGEFERLKERLRKEATSEKGSIGAMMELGLIGERDLIGKIDLWCFVGEVVAGIFETLSSS